MLFELGRMGYIKIVRGNRYKGFEYKINNWNYLESLQHDSRNMVKTILENIKSVARSPTVDQNVNGLHKAQKISKKSEVVQSN